MQTIEFNTEGENVIYHQTLRVGDSLYRQGWECPLPSSVKDGNTAYHQACGCPVPIRMGIPLTFKGGNASYSQASRMGMPFTVKEGNVPCLQASKMGMSLSVKRQWWKWLLPSNVWMSFYHPASKVGMAFYRNSSRVGMPLTVTQTHQYTSSRTKTHWYSSILRLLWYIYIYK